MDLPLLTRTPPGWAPCVLADPAALLADHVHLEKKAASNALDLLLRCPRKEVSAEWTEALASVARDEAAHLARVVRLLGRRGGALPPHHQNPYAAALHRTVRRGQGPRELLDRLLVSLLLEARSFERFEALAGAATGDLGALYRELCASERGHFRTFWRLARLAAPEQEAASRLARLKAEEAEILAAQAPGPRIYSGCRES